MGFPWRKVVTAVSTAAGTAFLGPFGPLVGAGVGAALSKDDADMLEELGEKLEELDKNPDITNDERRLIMTGEIRWALYEKNRRTPKEREVNWLLETLLMIYKSSDGGLVQ